MDATLTNLAAAEICRHMNDDHADALLAYARAYAGRSDAHSAELLTLDALGMQLRVHSRDASAVEWIAFDHSLVDTSDARQTLITMARRALADSSPQG